MMTFHANYFLSLFVIFYTVGLAASCNQKFLPVEHRTTSVNQEATSIVFTSEEMSLIDEMKTQIVEGVNFVIRANNADARIKKNDRKELDSVKRLNENINISLETYMPCAVVSGIYDQAAKGKLYKFCFDCCEKNTQRLADEDALFKPEMIDSLNMRSIALLYEASDYWLKGQRYIISELPDRSRLDDFNALPVYFKSKNFFYVPAYLCSPDFEYIVKAELPEKIKDIIVAELRNNMVVRRSTNLEVQNRRKEFGCDCIQNQFTNRCRNCSERSNCVIA